MTHQKIISNLPYLNESEVSNLTMALVIILLIAALAIAGTFSAPWM